MWIRWIQIRIRIRNTSFLRFSLAAKASPQVGQAWGRSPVCTREWTRSWAGRENSLPQTAQLNDFLK
jgi:hypothetical protein